MKDECQLTSDSVESGKLECDVGMSLNNTEHGPSSYLECIETTDPPCGQVYWWKRNAETGTWKLTVWLCHRHTCETCAQIKAERHGRRLLEHVGTRPCHHLVLTVERTPRPLRETVNHLYSSLRALKKRCTWKKHIVGGVWFFDCEYNGNTKVFGPHLHLLIEAENPPLVWLGAAWHEITGDSWVIDCSVIDMGVDDRASAVFYVAKYPFKGFKDEVEAMAIYERAMKGKRKFGAIGAWYGVLHLSGRKKRLKTS